MLGRWAAAHQLGMEYHRYLTKLSINGRQGGDECERLGDAYLDAFLDLEEYLASLEASDDVLALRKSAKKHIDLVRKDLKLLREQN